MNLFTRWRTVRAVRYLAYALAVVLWAGVVLRDVWCAVVREVRTNWADLVLTIAACERSHETKGMSQRPKLRDIDFTDL